MSVASLLAAFATLAVLGIAGIGIAGLIAPRVSRSAQAALAPVVATAIVLVTSPTVLVVESPLLVVAIVLGLLTVLTLGRRRDSIAIVRTATAPAALACVAIALAAAPALKHGTWAAATTGNQDAYIWVSQARSLEHGQPSGPPATTPDRVPFDLIAHQSWPVAIPAGLAELAAATGLDPVHAYGLFASMIVGLLALGVFFAACGCMRWSQRRSIFAALVVALNGFVLFSSFYGWQAQVLLTTAGTLFVLMLPDCFEEKSGVRECLGPALFGACGIAVYGWAFGPFVLVALAACWELRRRRNRLTVRSRSFWRRFATLAALTLAIGSVPIARALITVGRGATNASSAKLSFWRQYAWGFPSDALGLVPRSPQDVIPGIAWEVLALAIAAILIVRGLRSAYASQSPRCAVLATASLTIVVELVALALGGSSPYPSLKLMAYSAPLWTLLVLTPQSGRLLPVAVQTRAAHLSPAFVRVLTACFVFATGCLFFTTTAFAMSRGLRETHPATEVRPAASAAQALPAGKVILLAVEDAWDQVWLAYFLRDRPVALLDPSIAYTGYSAHAAARAQAFNAPASFEIRDRSPGGFVWRDQRFGIYALHHSG